MGTMPNTHQREVRIALRYVERVLSGKPHTESLGFAAYGARTAKLDYAQNREKYHRGQQDTDQKYDEDYLQHGFSFLQSGWAGLAATGQRAAAWARPWRKAVWQQVASPVWEGAQAQATGFPENCFVAVKRSTVGEAQRDNSDAEVPEEIQSTRIQGGS